MRRILVLACVFGSFAFGSGRAEEESGSHAYSQNANATGGIISFCNDPNCAGCRAFLAGYGEGGEPNCCCDVTSPDGSGAGGYGPGDGTGMGEDLLASDYGAGYGYESAAPNMIGDSLIGGGMLTHMGESPSDANAASLYSFHTFKVAEDESPWPKNRAYFDVNAYDNVPGTDQITRFMMGFERTFLDQTASIGFRLPVWSVDIENVPTTFPAAVPFGAAGTSNAVGDLTITLKGALAERSAGVLTSGFSFTIPTGPDTLGGVDPFYTMNNVSHRGAVQPWLGWYRASESRSYGFFTQAFLAFDLPIDRDDADYLYLDLGTGYRVERDGFITAITPMFEAHWSTPITNQAQTVSLTPLGTSSLSGLAATTLTSGVLGYRNQVNLTSAVNLELAGSRTLVLGLVVPTVGPQVMDFELVGQLNFFTW